MTTSEEAKALVVQKLDRLNQMAELDREGKYGVSINVRMVPDFNGTKLPSVINYHWVGSVTSVVVINNERATRVLCESSGEDYNNVLSDLIRKMSSRLLVQADEMSSAMIKISEIIR